MLLILQLHGPSERLTVLPLKANWVMHLNMLDCGR